jgi:hypothetical protein
MGHVLQLVLRRHYDSRPSPCVLSYQQYGILEYYSNYTKAEPTKIESVSVTSRAKHVCVCVLFTSAAE